MKVRGTRALTAASIVVTALTLAACGSSSGPSASSSVSTPRNVPGSGPVPAATGDWPTLLHDASHFGAATVPGPTSDSVRWQKTFGGPIVAGPVSIGNVAYVASDDGVLHSIDIASGRVRWSFSGGADYGYGDLSTAPAILPDGLLLWPGPRSRLFALSAAGKLRWTLPTIGTPLTPVIDEAGRLLVVEDSVGNLSGYRLESGDRPPARLWTRHLAKASFGNPALATNGTIYETAGDSLFAVAPSGRLLWQVRTPDAVEVSAAVSENGTVIFGSDDRREYGVAPNGGIRWHHAIGNYTYSSPLTLAGDLVAFGDHSGNINLWNAGSGQPIAKDHGAGEIWTSAAVDSRGDVYFASRTGGIYGFAADHHQLFRLQTNAKFDSYPAITADGTLLIGDDNGVLRAIG